MRKITFCMIILSLLLSGKNQLIAQEAPPHTIKGESKVANVALNWKSPAELKTLQWHSGEDYDGVDGESINGEVPTLFIANRFDKNDLNVYVGSIIDSIFYFHYRKVMDVSVLIYENGTIVREQAVNTADFVLNEMQSVKLDDPYTIPEDTELMIAVKFRHGTNWNFIGIMDRGPGIVGKGDLYSFDGKSWKNIKRGNFLVTANIQMPKANDPDGYNVYRDDVKVNTELIADTSTTLKKEPTGTHNYSVSAVYGSDEKKSYAISLTNIQPVDSRPVVTNLRASVDGLSATLTWRTPFLAESELTWCNKEAGSAMGATSGTLRKIWATNVFTYDQLLSYPNHQITAMNIMLNSAVTEMKLVIFQDNVIVYYEDIPAEDLPELPVNEWKKYTLATPFAIEPGTDIRFGYYVVHASGDYPGKLDTGPAMKTACYISTSTVSSSGFENTKPSWTSIENSATANWMLSADIEPLEEITTPVVKDYSVYRNGEMIKSGVNEPTYTDTAEPGTFTYTVVANYTDDTSSIQSSSVDATFNLPAGYISPTIYEKTFEDGELSLKWEVYTDLPLELIHHGDPAGYWVLTNEGQDVEIYIGAEFSAEKLLPYANHELTGINLMLMNDMKELEVLISSGGKTLASKTVTEITSNEMTYVTFDSPVAIPTSGSMVVGYRIVYEDGKYPIALDAGPNVTGGAMLSFDGAKWYSIKALDTSFNNNVIVSATVRLKGTEGISSPDNIFVDTMPAVSHRRLQTVSLQEMKEGTYFGINKTILPSPAEDDKPEVSYFRLYCNNALVTETPEKEYAATLPYGTFSYSVSAVYTNGWESALSEAFEFSHKVENLSPAPYGLSGTIEGDDLLLLWQSPESANELNYQNKESGSFGVGLTRSGGVEGNYLISYTAEDLEDKVGEHITHVKLGLFDNNVNIAAVVIFVDRNLYYTQYIDVTKLVVGENTIRLDNYFEIPAGREICIGYYLQHDNGLKPNLTDEGPAEDGKGNLICTGTTWRTLKSMNSALDYNWRISAVLQKENTELGSRVAPQKDDAVVTYAVYKDNAKIADGISETNYTVLDAIGGVYTVVAVTEEVESAPSNAVTYSKPYITLMNEVSEADTSVVPYTIDIEIEGMLFDDVEIALTGDNASNFTLSKTTVTPSELEQGNVTFSVTFDATVSGVYLAAISIGDYLNIPLSVTYNKPYVELIEEVEPVNTETLPVIIAMKLKGFVTGDVSTSLSGDDASYFVLSKSTISPADLENEYTLSVRFDGVEASGEYKTTVIISDSETEYLHIPVVVNYTMKDVSIDAITAGIKVFTGNGMLNVTGAEPGMQIKLYNTQGQLILDSTISSSNDTFVLPQGRGVYVVQIGGNSYKIVK